MKLLLISLQILSLCISIFSQVTTKDREFYKRHELVLIAVRIINTSIQVPIQLFALYTFLKHTSFFSQKAQKRGIIMICAIAWVVLNLVNVIHIVILRTVSILGKQYDLWFKAFDGFCFKVFKPSLMLVEVITLAVIIVKISQRQKVIQIEEDEEDDVFNAIQSSDGLAKGNHKN